MPYSSTYMPSDAFNSYISDYLVLTLNRRYASPELLSQERMVELTRLEGRLRSIQTFQMAHNTPLSRRMSGRLALRRHMLDEFRSAGKTLAHLMAGGTDYDVEEVFNGLPNALLNNDTFMTLFREVATEFDLLLVQCASCNVWYDGGTQTAESHTHNGNICDECDDSHITTGNGYHVDPDTETVVEAYSRWHNGALCDIDYYLEDDACVAAPDMAPPNHPCGETLYITRRLRDSLEWEDTGNGNAPYDLDDLDDLDDLENNNKRGVYEYQRHPLRSNGRYFNEPDTAGVNNVPIGMELEVFCVGAPAGALDTAGLDWILEYDGSLDETHGVEIVSPPLIRKQWKMVIPKLCAALEDEHTESHDPPCGSDYGIHLSVNTKYVSKLAIMRMSMFFMADSNLDFIRAMCQRREIYSAPYQRGLGQCPKDKQKVSSIGRLSADKKRLVGLGKYMPVGIKAVKSTTGDAELIEFRGFNSTHNPGHMAKNMEFVWSLLRWTSTAVCSSGWDHTAYLEWLATAKADYPALTEYLTTPSSFQVKDHGVVKNVWGVTLTGKDATKIAVSPPEAYAVPILNRIDKELARLDGVLANVRSLRTEVEMWHNNMADAITEAQATAASTTPTTTET